jgi:flavin reductase ActVB
MSDATTSREFRDAMASFPSGVTIVTTVDAAGTWWGFTATSFCSVSLDPPLVLVCLSKTAQCYMAFARADQWQVHILGPDHANLALRFATRGACKFSGAEFIANENREPVLPAATANLHCSTFETYSCGDHTVLIGLVQRAALTDTSPAVYFDRRFHTLPNAKRVLPETQALP